jgi:hypothetical protein
MLNDASLWKQYRGYAVSVAVYLTNRTTIRSVVARTQFKAGNGSGKNAWLKHLRVFSCFAFVYVANEKQRILDYRATSGIYVGYSKYIKQYVVYDRLARTLHHSREVEFREWQRYTAPNAADLAFLNEHFYRDVIDEPKSKPTPLQKQQTKHQMEEPLDDDSPPDPPKPHKMSRELAGLESSLGVECKPQAKGSGRNRAGQDTLGESAQLAIEDEEFNVMIAISAAAAIFDDHESGIDNPNSSKAVTNSLPAIK